jgi:hypothetical protein
LDAVTVRRHCLAALPVGVLVHQDLVLGEPSQTGHALGSRRPQILTANNGVSWTTPIEYYSIHMIENALLPNLERQVCFWTEAALINFMPKEQQ